MRTLAVVLLVILLSACASSRGFNREALRSEVTPQRTITEEDIKKALAARAQLPHPFKLGVYFVPPAQSGWYYRAQWTWTSEDKERVLASFAELKTKGAIGEAFVIPESTVEGKDNKAVRLAAARSGADAVLIVAGSADIDRYNNALGPLYILLVTAYFVPGTVVDGLFMTNASMWDVANEYLYLGAEAEGMVNKTAPAFFIEEEHIIKDAKAASLETLAKDISGRVAQMSARSK